MTVQTDLAGVLQEFVLADFSPSFGQLKETFRSHELWSALRGTGTALWLDTGDLEAARGLWSREIEGLTTNNTLLNAEIQKGIYDGVIPQLADWIRRVAPDTSPQEIVLEIAFGLNAIHALKLVETFDAWVSVELHTDVAHDVDRTLAYARRYHAICPQRFIVKIPLTPAGLLAARQVVREGITVNYTLGFSARQNFVIARIADPHFSNVFMGRLNAYIAGEGIGDGRFVGEKATQASQRCLRECREQGGRTQQIGASMRSGQQVHDLAGLDVFTMPVKVAQGFLELGVEPQQIRSRVDDAYEPEYGEGFDERSEGLHTLWEVDSTLRGAVDALTPERLDSISAQELQDHFADCGAGDLFPKLNEEELEALRSGGKIPQREVWREKLAAGEVGLDALFTQGGLLSFSADQQALDDRIRSLIA